MGRSKGGGGRNTGSRSNRPSGTRPRRPASKSLAGLRREQDARIREQVKTFRASSPSNASLITNEEVDNAIKKSNASLERIATTASTAGQSGQGSLFSRASASRRRRGITENNREVSIKSAIQDGVRYRQAYRRNVPAPSRARINKAYAAALKTSNPTRSLFRESNLSTQEKFIAGERYQKESIFRP